jgi:DNA-binding response OmpR family regulator
MRGFSIGSRAEAGFRSALRDAGFVSLVTKPFEPREVVETIARTQLRDQLSS